jgi:polysaccharide export outer membrane protein
VATLAARRSSASGGAGSSSSDPMDSTMTRAKRSAHMTPKTTSALLIVVFSVVVVSQAHAQAVQQPARPAAPAPAVPRPAQPTPQTPPRPGGTQPSPTTAASTGLPIPTDYVIGPDDVLGIVFWRDADMTGDVTVRPDGMITLPLIRDVKAAGLRPDELREQIQKAAAKFIEDPNVTVVVRQINSRNVFITGQVSRPGPYPVSGQMTVLQLIAVAGGLSEFADEKGITITRTEGGKTQTLKFNYKDVARGKNMQQNIVLKPGDTVVVP